jgi:hypothetical protein
LAALLIRKRGEHAPEFLDRVVLLRTADIVGHLFEPVDIDYLLSHNFVLEILPRDHLQVGGFECDVDSLLDGLVLLLRLLKAGLDQKVDELLKVSVVDFFGLAVLAERGFRSVCSSVNELQIEPGFEVIFWHSAVASLSPLLNPFEKCIINDFQVVL